MSSPPCTNPMGLKVTLRDDYCDGHPNGGGGVTKYELVKFLEPFSDDTPLLVREKGRLVLRDFTPQYRLLKNGEGTVLLVSGKYAVDLAREDGP